MSKIYEFNPVIYPFRLYVAVNPTFEEVEETFYAYDVETNERSNMLKDDFYNDYGTIATCYPIVHKKDAWISILVRIRLKGQMDAGTIAHEASHICDFVCQRYGIYRNGFNEGEATGYLTGWIANCINSVKRNKVKIIEINT